MVAPKAPARAFTRLWTLCKGIGGVFAATAILLALVLGWLAVETASDRAEAALPGPGLGAVALN